MHVVGLEKSVDEHDRHQICHARRGAHDDGEQAENDDEADQDQYNKPTTDTSVNSVHVISKPVEDVAQRCCIEEAEVASHDAAYQTSMDGPRGRDDAPKRSR